MFVNRHKYCFNRTKCQGMKVWVQVAATEVSLKVSPIIFAKVSVCALLILSAESVIIDIGDNICN